MVKQTILLSSDSTVGIILDGLQLAGITWLINDSSTFMRMTFRYANALCYATGARRRYYRANSSDRPFISITLLECNFVYVPSISRRVNLFSHWDNITQRWHLARPL
jgi:hypothetical protein